LFINASIGWDMQLGGSMFESDVRMTPIALRMTHPLKTLQVESENLQLI